MKLHLELLSRLIDLPTKDPDEIRKILDDLGLEVKDQEGEGLATVYNIETLANRGDTLHAVGVSREFAARYLTQIKLPPVAPDLPEKRTSLPVRKGTEKCMRYALLEMQLPSTMSLRSDVASIMGSQAEKRHPIVDLLNFVQLEVGQPMHAFDKDKIEGEIIVELSTKVEEIEALDGKSYKVPPGSILIKDRKKIVAVGGVIGCANSMVQSGTRGVLIEAASFDPVSVRLTARGMGISTDASYLFERGCDQEIIPFALKRLLSLAGGGGGSVKNEESAHAIGYIYLEDPLPKRTLTLRLQTLRQQLHLPRLPEVEVGSRLKYLGFGVEYKDKEFSVTVPSWRLFDVHTEEDLIEEIARAQGYNSIKAELPPLDPFPPPLNQIEILLEKASPALLGNGFYEVISRNFFSPKQMEIIEKLSPKIKSSTLSLKNSIESDFAYLKSTNILHLAALADENRKMGVQSFKVFEIAKTFSRNLNGSGSYEFEDEVLTLACAGRWNQGEWRQSESFEELIFKLKGLLESLSLSFGVKPGFSEGSHELLHPGIQSKIRVGKSDIGHFGKVHPFICDALAIKEEVVYAEVRVKALLEAEREVEYGKPSDYPSIRRDITLLLSPRSYSGDVIGWISTMKPQDLKDITLVDDFVKGGEASRRVTYRLTFQSDERTLVHGDVDETMAGVLSALRNKHSLELAA